jgi:hypothetical protein
MAVAAARATALMSPVSGRALSVAIAFICAVGCGTGPQHVSRSSGGAYEAALAVLDEGFAVAWYDTRDGRAEIYLRLLDVRGRPSSPEWRLTDDLEQSYEASVEAAGDGFVVAWYGRDDAGRLTARIGRFTGDGRNMWLRALGASGRNPVVRRDAGSIFCAWIQPDDEGGEAVWAAWWDLDGTEIVTRRRLASASRTTWNVNADLAGGAAWVVFDAEAELRSSELFLVRVDRETSSTFRLTGDDGAASKYPDIAIAGGTAAVTWFDERDGNTEVYLAVLPVTDLAGGIERHAVRVTTTPGESIGAYLAWNGSRLGLAWSDDTEGRHDVYFQAFDPGGRALAPAQRVTRTRAASLIPAIRPWRGGFALAWNEYEAPRAAGHGGGRSQVAFVTIR